MIFKLNFVISILFLLNFVIFSSINFVNVSAAPNELSIYEKIKYKRQIDEQNDGLYDSKDKVISLTAKTLKSTVFNQPYGSLVEFYNSFCGFCRRFAPIYKKIAEDLNGWKRILIVTAIDCAKDENNAICREFEVMAYPTIRYFSPHYLDGQQKIGKQYRGHSEDELMYQLLGDIQTSKSTTKFWPNLNLFNDTDKRKIFIDDSDDSSIDNEHIKFAFLINENETDSLIGRQVILDLFGYKGFIVRRRKDFDEGNNVLVIERSTGEFEDLGVGYFERNEIVKTIKEYLKEKSINLEQIVTEKSVQLSQKQSTTQTYDGIDDKLDEVILNNVKSMKGKIFQSDLEQAVRFTLFHEVAQFAKIDGRRLTALQQFIAVLVRYFPFGSDGKKFLNDVQDFVMNAGEEIDGHKFLEKLQEFKANRKVFSSNRWVGCASNKPGLRRFPCSLWTLFHFLTVQAAEKEISNDPLEILQAMHGYVRHFFGCTDCSQHFQQMAVKNRIWNVTSKDDAVLWLWSSHNEVNKRLSKDATEDPDFPKIQFPSREMCPACRRKILTNHHNHHQYPIEDENSGNVEWNLVEILSYLKSMYAATNVSRFGVNDDQALPAPAALKSGDVYTNRIFGNVLNDMDIRMGVLLYIFCICMMFLAVKLILKRGYRKKLYIHDLLGKV
uniref:Sulfhydryl oxidase n=1 Tax=Corethrella appendiculata TaxID=1370023 RepID=U5EST8_9DIPT